MAFKKNSKQFAAKGGAQKKYVPTVKDSFNNFLGSALNLPFKTAQNSEIISVQTLQEKLEKLTKETISPRTLISIAMGVDDEDQIGEALTAYFDPTDENQVRTLQYLLTKFEGAVAHFKPEYAKPAAELIKGIKDQYELK